MIYYFKTREEKVEYVRTHGVGANYLSYVEETGKTSYKYREPIGLGEFLHVTGLIDTKPGKGLVKELKSRNILLTIKTSRSK